MKHCFKLLISSSSTESQEILSEPVRPANSKAYNVNKADDANPDSSRPKLIVKRFEPIRFYHEKKTPGTRIVPKDTKKLQAMKGNSVVFPQTSRISKLYFCHRIIISWIPKMKIILHRFQFKSQPRMQRQILRGRGERFAS